MSLRKNVLASYVSQIYVTAAGIILVPIYIKYMGAEAYGLVGFFAMLQTWFNLLDVGLTPAIARETARYSAGSMDAVGYRRLTRSLEGVFGLVALIGGGVLFVIADWIVANWLNATQLTDIEVTRVLQIIAVIIVLRWISGLYRGIISGFERLIWLSSFNGCIATFRFVLIIFVLEYFGATPLVFFGFQLIVAIVECVGQAWYVYQLLPRVSPDQQIGWSLKPLKPLLRFSLSIAFTSTVWIMVTQTDKLILSKILTLSDYGYFTLAVLVASAVTIMSGPISGAIMPRMARLQAERRYDQLISVYRQTTQLMIIIVAPIALMLIFFSGQALWAWTGDKTLVEKTSSVLTLYAVGNGLMAIGAFPFYLQYAKGDLKLHVIGNLFFVLLLIPSVVWSAMHHGVVGVGWAWIVGNGIYFLLWVPLVHRRFAPGLHLSWLWQDVIQPISLALLCACGVALFAVWSTSRVQLCIELVVLGVVLCVFSYMRANKVFLKSEFAKK